MRLSNEEKQVLKRAHYNCARALRGMGADMYAIMQGVQVLKRVHVPLAEADSFYIAHCAIQSTQEAIFVAAA